MRAPRRGAVVRFGAGLLLVTVLPTSAWTADKKPTPAADVPAMASEKSRVKPAAERAIVGGAVGRAAERRAPGSVVKSSGKAFGPRIPEHLRKALEAQIARRIDRDILAQRDLRREAVGLLETFVKEES